MLPPALLLSPGGCGLPSSLCPAAGAPRPPSYRLSSAGQPGALRAVRTRTPAPLGAVPVRTRLSSADPRCRGGFAAAGGRRVPHSGWLSWARSQSPLGRCAGSVRGQGQTVGSSPEAGGAPEPPGSSLGSTWAPGSPRPCRGAAPGLGSGQGQAVNHGSWDAAAACN